MKSTKGLVPVIVAVVVSAAFAAPPPGYGLVWSDEFIGPTIDANNWSFDTGVGVPDGWGNAEK
jgi:hypothetical protein